MIPQARPYPAAAVRAVRRAGHRSRDVPGHQGGPRGGGISPGGESSPAGVVKQRLKRQDGREIPRTGTACSPPPTALPPSAPFATFRGIAALVTSGVVGQKAADQLIATSPPPSSAAPPPANASLVPRLAFTAASAHALRKRARRSIFTTTTSQPERAATSAIPAPIQSTTNDSDPLHSPRLRPARA